MHLIPIFTVVAMLAFTAWYLRKDFKLLQFRQVIRPGHIVRIKINGVSVLAEVLTRPGSDRIFYQVLTPDQAAKEISISKVYPL